MKCTFDCCCFCCFSGQLESSNSDVEETGKCAHVDSCEDLGKTVALNDAEFRLKLIEAEISALDSEPFSDDKEGPDDKI